MIQSYHRHFSHFLSFFIMQSRLQAAINQLCAEKNLEREVIIEAIENAISVAYKKDFGSPNLRTKVILGDDISDMKIFEIRTVVKKVNDHELEISEKEAKQIRPDAQEGDTVYVPVPPHENFGRIAAQTAKHIINQKIQESEREMLFKKFKDREGMLLNARVQKVDRDAVLLEIDGVSTLLYKPQQIPNEKYFTGQRIKVYLDRVESTTKGPQLRITRSSNEFIKALFEQEIPEMREGVVFIEKMSREPGIRCKVAVNSVDPSVDPVGAFVGQRGSRINTVMEEVGDERLDVIQYFEDPKKFLIESLSTSSKSKIAKINFMKGENGEDRVQIFVRDEDRAIIIGKGGQNVRLAGHLINMPIDVITYDGPLEENLENEATKPKVAREVSEKVSIDQLQGVDEKIIQTLKEMGLSQVKQFEGLKASELAEVGISLEEAESVILAVGKYING